VINHDKLVAKIEMTRKKPKEKSKWQQRLDQMQEMQKQVQDQKAKGKK
jgi:YidC/Oxa1 family membrane protein insertase